MTQTAVSWTRGGSSVQFTRVTFEYSTDNVNYTPLGDGTAVGNNWTLTGLNLPTGQNIYIRARGYYRSGFSNGSESITGIGAECFYPPGTDAGRLQKVPWQRRPFDINLPLTGSPGSNAAAAARAAIIS